MCAITLDDPEHAARDASCRDRFAERREGAVENYGSSHASTRTR
jgi:hypothetical protein